MVRMPNLRAAQRKAEEQQMKFTGLDYRAEPNDGSCSDCSGITSRAYPSIRPHNQMKTIASYQQLTCVKGFGNDVLICAGTNIYWNGSKAGTLTHLNERGEIDVTTQRHAEMINTQIVILPDKLIFDTSTGGVEPIDGMYPASGFVVYRQFVEEEQQYYHILDFSMGISDDADRSGADDLFQQVQLNDTVFLTGFTSIGTAWSVDNKPDGITVRYIDREGYRIGFYDSSFPKKDEEATNGTEYVNGKKYTPHTETLYFEYRCPELELIAEADNRLWGTSGNTIYACALGSPRNWFRYDGLADDAYALAVAGNAPFTAIKGYGTHVCFFKADCIHRVYGSKPSNYSLNTLLCPGVQSGGEETVQVINGVLWYAAPSGIYAYDGSSAECVSAQLGIQTIDADFAAAAEEGYYIEMDCGHGRQLYCLDTNNAVWTIWDKGWYAAAANVDGKLILATAAGEILQAAEGVTLDEWSIELNEFTEGVAGRKSYSKLVIQCDMAREAHMEIAVRFDGGRWIPAFTMEGKYGKRVMYAPLPPNRCYGMAMRITGRGDVTIKGIARAYSLLSDVR